TKIRKPRKMCWKQGNGIQALMGSLSLVCLGFFGQFVLERRTDRRYFVRLRIQLGLQLSLSNNTPEAASYSW
ncbi:hypothetical protein BD309DRAFT_948091, partial [Dichomitus squalens]